MNRLSLTLALALIPFAPIALSQPLRPATPQPRSVEYEWMSVADWYRAHADDVETAAKGQARVLFLGDSITQGWQWAPSWEREFSQYQPANFGIGGDKTENLLWRIQNGATGKLAPEVVVMMIGVNNFGHNNDTPEAVFLGIAANLEQVKASFPETRILLLGVLPYEQSGDSPKRDAVARLNRLLASLAGQRVTFLDAGQRLLLQDGSISKEIMADFLHPTEKGYDELAKAVAPAVAALLDN